MVNMLQDIPACSTYEQLEFLASNRDIWRAHQPTRMTHSSRSSGCPPPNQTTYLLRSRKPKTKPATKKPVTTPTAADEQTKQAARYRRRDAHEAFFRPRAKQTKRGGRPKKAKTKRTPPWTNKQRQAFARAYYRERHGSPTKSPSPTPISNQNAAPPPNTPQQCMYPPTTTIQRPAQPIWTMPTWKTAHTAVFSSREVNT